MLEISQIDKTFNAGTVNEKTALISLRIPGSLGQTAESTCQTLLTGMMVYLTELHSEYPGYIEVLEGE